MAFTLDFDDGSDLDIGSLFDVWGAFKDMAKQDMDPGDKKYPDLYAIPQINLAGDTVSNAQFKRMQAQARLWLSQYSPTSRAKEVLDAILAGKEGTRRGGRRASAQAKRGTRRSRHDHGSGKRA